MALNTSNSLPRMISAHFCRTTLGIPSGPWALYGDNLAIYMPLDLFGSYLWWIGKWFWIIKLFLVFGLRRWWWQEKGFGKSFCFILIVADVNDFSLFISGLERGDPRTAAISSWFPNKFICRPYIGCRHVF